MSTGNKIFNWCRMPPEPPKNRHKKLLAGSIIFTVLSVSLFASWPLFNMSMMTGQADALVAPSVAFSVANLAEGPKYIQNVTYQCVNDTYQSVQDISPVALRFSLASIYRNGDLGNVTMNLINYGEENLTVTAMEIYHSGVLFAVINGSFTIDAHSEGLFKFQVNNLTELSKSEVQWLTGKNTTSSDWAQYWCPVRYYAMLRTTEGVAITDDCLFFPTVPLYVAA